MVRTLLLLGLLATSASAQSVTLKFTGTDSSTYRFNVGECTAKKQITWTSTIALGICSDLKLWSTELECADTPGLTDVRYASVTSAELALKTGTFDVTFADLPAFKYGDAGVVCGTQSVERPHKICGAVGTMNSVGGVCTQQQAKSLGLIYDTKPPVSPTIEDVLEQDGALLLKFSASADTAVVHVEARPQGEAAFTPRGELATASGSSIRISNLVNGTTYDLQAIAEDAAKNLSPPSELQSATPRLTRGFWASYRAAGGAERGGCQAVHGLPLLLAGGLWLMRRKRS